LDGGEDLLLIDVREPEEVAIAGIKGIYVRSYKFDADFAYPKADVDLVRKQLGAPGWQRLVEVRSRKEQQNVDIYLLVEQEKANGLAIIASQPREFTIVNIVGSIDMRKLHELEGQFGIPKLEIEEIERLIYPVSFYRNKARHVKAACERLVTHYGGRVPTTMEELLTLPGVGRKTANLVLILAFKSQENICVDIHVHRISNRLGWIKTETPEESEQALYHAAERQWWPLINLYLVTWGQNVCRPVYPRCGACVLAPQCPRIGVTKVARAKSQDAA